MVHPGPPLPPPAHDAPLPAARLTATGVRVHSSVPYAAVPGIRPLELDLYLPPVGGAPVPAAIFLHGGGWRMGSRRMLGPAYARVAPDPFEQVAATGIAVASVDYRLSGEAQWPVQLHDAKAAVRWLRARAPEAGIDPDRIAAWGESAGAHLALLLGLAVEDSAGLDLAGPDLAGRELAGRELAGSDLVGSVLADSDLAGSDLAGEVGLLGPSATVSAVAAWYAPSDLGALPDDLGSDPAAPDTREALLLGAPLSRVPELARQASPISYVRADAPPILLLHGRADRLIPCVQSERLYAALQSVGARVDYDTYPGADHMWLGSTDAPAQALARTIDFFRAMLQEER